jgi:hypothetical protein
VLDGPYSPHPELGGTLELVVVLLTTPSRQPAVRRRSKVDSVRPETASTNRRVIAPRRIKA